MDQRQFLAPRFSSFFWAGFECAYALNRNRVRLDLLAATKHDQYCREDYQLVKGLGITTVREGLSWHQIDQGHSRYDFSRFQRLMQIGKEEGIQQVWDLNHFDYPPSLDPFSAQFAEQFARYAQECIKVLRKYQQNTLYIVPINEISYFAWIGGEVGNWAPYAKHRGWELKQQFVRAALAAMAAIWQVDANVRFIHVDPIVRRAARKDSSQETQRLVKEFNHRVRYQTWDMLSGKLAPELGGEAKYLDILGINYYYFNQEWTLDKKDQDGNHLNWGIGWQTRNRISFAKILADIHQRYQRPLVVSETGGWGEDRWKWWDRTLKEIDDARHNHVPVYGVCAYPAVDRPEWEMQKLTNSGLWDFANDDPECRRIPHERTLQVIRRYQKKLQPQPGP